MKSLYDYNSEIESCIDTETGEVDESKLAEIQMEYDTKVENIALWCKDIQAEITMIKNEADSLTARKKSAERKLESLKHYLSDNLQSSYKSAKAVVSPRISEAVAFVGDFDIESLPAEYINVKIDKSANKTELKKALKAGTEIDGVYIEKRKSVTIK